MATWTTPSTWASGTVVRSTFLDAQIKGNMDYLGTTHHHATGTAGEGAGYLGPLTYLDNKGAAVPAPPTNATLMRMFATATSLGYVTSATAVYYLSNSTHSHTLTNRAESGTVMPDVFAASATSLENMLAGNTNDGHNPVSYGDISDDAVVLVPTKAGNSVLVASFLCGNGQDSDSNGDAHNTAYIQINVNGSEVMETSNLYGREGAATALERFSGAVMDMFVSTNVTATATFQARYKVTRNSGDASRYTTHGMRVCEIGFTP
jgi:hypothetical protein